MLQKVRFTEHVRPRVCYSTDVRTGDNLYPCSTFVPMASRFSVKNPATGKTWKLQELHDELVRVQAELEILEKIQDEKVLTMDDYGQDFVRRCEIHGQEFNLFLEDLQIAIEFLQTNFKKVRQVELPSFIK